MEKIRAFCSKTTTSPRRSVIDVAPRVGLGFITSGTSAVRLRPSSIVKGTWLVTLNATRLVRLGLARDHATRLRCDSPVNSPTKKRDCTTIGSDTTTPKLAVTSAQIHWVYPGG